MSNFGGIRPVALRRRRENGFEIAVRDSLAVGVKETVEVRVGLDAVGVAPIKMPVPPCPNLHDLVALQQASPDFGEALSYLDEGNWHAYYNAFEALRAAVGSERQVQQLG
jgi:hypothetical protein